MKNPAAILKLMQARSKFTATHPKFAAFLEKMISGGVTEGTILEITVQKPGEAPVTANMRVQESDLELFDGLKDLK